MTPEILTQAPRRSELLNVEVEALERSLLELSVALRTKKMGENRWSLRCLWCFFKFLLYIYRVFFAFFCMYRVFILFLCFRFLVFEVFFCF